MLELQRRYADLIVRVGVNLQPNQRVLLTCEHAARDFAVLVVEACYRAGARHVDVRWREPLTLRAQLTLAPADAIDDAPGYEFARMREVADERWAAIWLAGEEMPSALESVDADRLKRHQTLVARVARPFTVARQTHQCQWTIASVPTQAWARQVFPELDGRAGVDALWSLILSMTRADQPDPIGAWRAHIDRLQAVGAYLMAQQIQAVRFFDPKLGPDGRALTDLTVGLTPASFWETAYFKTPEGLGFVANLPSEEIFTTPHRMRADGWVRTSRPIYPLKREVRDAYFEFSGGECVAASAAAGEDALRAFLDLPGARRLGEIALVDSRSPLTQTARTFYDILYDENAACHIAFGQALAMCVTGAGEMDKAEREAFGLNDSDVHSDFMIGTPTMHVIGLRADGSTVDVMRDGRFVDAAAKPA